MAKEGFSRQHIGQYCRRLSRPHTSQLVLLEIGIDPEPARRDDAQQVGAIGNVSADLCGSIADVAVDRRVDLGVAEIEVRGFEIRRGLRDARAGLGDLRIAHTLLLPRGSEPSFGRLGGRLRLLVGC
jgi:hypothetical protein